jgi:4a-hydroxytetrahydrobiopterin dehydratase
MEDVLSRKAASDAVSDVGWRFLLGTLRTSVPVGSTAVALEVAQAAVAACGAGVDSAATAGPGGADGHLRTDLRPDRVVFTMQSLAAERPAVTTRDVELARRISSAVEALGLTTGPDIGTEAAVRSVQLLEIAFDALDIPAIRPFWKAVLGYADEPGSHGPRDPLIDPVGQGPAVWFQQMDEPRPQRNRIHFDLCVPHDEAAARIEAALAAGGRLVSATRAPAFWILADAEGNEVCVTTWQGRDELPSPS